MKEEVSINIQPFQANLMETLKVAVEKETNLAIEKNLERLQGCIESFNKSKGKVQAFVTSAVETAEKNLQGEIETSLKEVKRLQKDVGLLRRSVRDDVATDLTTMKEEMAQISMKQSGFMSALNSSIESCQSELSSSMKEGLMEVKSDATSLSKVVNDTLAGIKLQIEELQNQRREEASRQVGDMSKLFERVTELEKNLLKMSRQYPYDDNILSEKVNSLVDSKIQRLEEKIRTLENSQSSISIKQSEVWRESLRLVQEEDKRNISEERNRTLSDVAKKVLAVASRRGHDPSLVELAKRIESGKIATSTPYHLQEEVNSSPESERSILTSEALSLCGIKLDDDEVLTPRRDSPTPEPLPSRSPSPTQSCLDSALNKSTPDAYIGAGYGAKNKESDTAKHVEDEGQIKIQSSSESVEVDPPPFTVKEDEESNGNSSIEGSITSYDEIIEVVLPNTKTPLPGKKAVDHGYNPTRLSNPEPYEGWDSLLTELRASGLILRDEENSSSSSCSYGSDSFESEE